MDDYIHVLIYHGQVSTPLWVSLQMSFFHSWPHLSRGRRVLIQGNHCGTEKMNYHEDPQYVTFTQLLEAPVGDATAILQERWPMPRYIVTEYEGSQV
ncbi:hypothetical protein GCK32_008075, partial [Trichostrongylus colubriformis]